MMNYRKIAIILVLLVFNFNMYSQSMGMSYQAVILEQNTDNTDNKVLSNKDISILFTIENSNGFEEYKEKHITKTDKYGMVNLIIGSGELVNSSVFSDIIWDGNNKKLKVEIDFTGNNNYELLSEQNLIYLPQPPSNETRQLISNNSDEILKETERAKKQEQINSENITVLKEEQKLQNNAIALNTAKISYPGDQDISGIAANSALLASFRYYYPDKDGDGFGGNWNVVYSPIKPEGYVNNNSDCDDTKNGVSIYPGAVEIPDDGIDQDCDGFDKITWYKDSDGDGFGNPNISILANLKPEGYVKNNKDCDDTPGSGASIHPGAIEIPNDGIDQNCDGTK